MNDEGQNIHSSEKQYDVFISYSSKDKTTADTLCALLEQSKIRCWIAPRDVGPGQSYAACITRAIKSSKVLVVVFSGNANRSEQVSREIEMAVKHGIIIIPFRVENTELSDEMEYYLSSRHWLDALTPPLEQHVDRLIQTIKPLSDMIDISDKNIGSLGKNVERAEIDTKVLQPQHEADLMKDTEEFEEDIAVNTGGLNTKGIASQIPLDTSPSQESPSLSKIEQNEKESGLIKSADTSKIDVLKSKTDYIIKKPLLNKSNRIFVFGIAAVIIVAAFILIISGQNPMFKGQYQDAQKWSDIIAVSQGTGHAVGLKKDGTVVAVGFNSDGQCNIEDWRNINALSASLNRTVGLRKDGTVVAVGYNYTGQCDVKDWRDIVELSAGPNHTIGLKKDGTVVTAGSNDVGQCDVEDWRDIVAVSAGYNHTIGLKKDGTVIAVGKDKWGQCNVEDWRDIVAISAGYYHSIALTKDGTVVAVGDNDNGQCDVKGWQDIIAVSAGDGYTIGLKKDGTVVAVGKNDNEQCNVEDWQNIIAVSAGDDDVIGLKSDGTIRLARTNK